MIYICPFSFLWLYIRRLRFSLSLCDFSVYMSFLLSVGISVCLSVCLYVLLTVLHSFFLSFCLSVGMSVLLTLRLSFCLSVCCPSDFQAVLLSSVLLFLKTNSKWKCVFFHNFQNSLRKSEFCKYKKYFFFLSPCLLFSLSVFFFLFLSVCLFLSVFVCLSLCLLVCLLIFSVYPFSWLS